ncbi:hypothetical protein X801_07942, partial [Opisthorchis viverrini]
MHAIHPTTANAIPDWKAVLVITTINSKYWHLTNNASKTWEQKGKRITASAHKPQRWDAIDELYRSSEEFTGMEKS